MPQLAFLPLPIKIPGLTDRPIDRRHQRASSQGFLAELNWAAAATKLSCSSEAIMIAIVGFILLVIFTGGRGGKKG